MNLETKITIYKFTPQVFTLTHKRFYIFSFPTGISSIHLINTVRLSILTVIQLLLLSKPNLCY